MRNNKGQFVKGNSERLGHKHSIVTKKKLSIAKKGIRNSPSTEFKKGHKTWIKGKHFKCNDALRLWRENGGIVWNKNMRGYNAGSKSSNWKGGITPLNRLLRTSADYIFWRKAVFERDNYTCVWCGDNKGGNLEADHIKPFALFPELRFAIDNGRTLCHECHKRTDTYGWGTRYKLSTK